MAGFFSRLRRRNRQTGQIAQHIQLSGQTETPPQPKDTLQVLTPEQPVNPATYIINVTNVQGQLVLMAEPKQPPPAMGRFAATPSGPVPAGGDFTTFEGDVVHVAPGSFMTPQGVVHPAPGSFIRTPEGETVSLGFTTAPPTVSTFGLPLKTGRGGGRRSTRTAPVSCLRIVSSVSPSSVNPPGTVSVTISGSLFEVGDSVRFVSVTDGSELPLANLVIANSTTITVDVDGTLGGGFYNVFVGPASSPQCVGVLLSGFNVIR